MLDNKNEDNKKDGSQRLVNQGHIILLLFFFVLALIFTIPTIYYFNQENKIWEIGLAFATAFYTAAGITILYHWVLINDISNLVARKLIVNKEFLLNIFNKEQRDCILKLLLEIYLEKDMGTLVKSDIIDQIAEDQVDYVLHGFDAYITLSKSKSNFPDFYKLTYKQTSYETVVTKKLTYYAASSRRIWDLLAEAEKDKNLGIGDIWWLPPNAPNAQTVTEKNIRDFYSKKLFFDHQELTAIYSIKRGKDLEHIIGTALNSDEYCVAVEFDLLEFDKIKIGQKAEKFSRFESYVYKHKNFISLKITNPFSNVHIIWDCIDTDIVDVTPFSSIHQVSEPQSLHPNNKKYALVSHTSGLPGHYVLFIWRFHNPPACPGINQSPLITISPSSITEVKE
jgi:hypothetical protein